jgi:cysteine desulfurase / selenocysteine lyase
MDEPFVYLNNAAASFPKAPDMAAAVATALTRVPLEPGRSGAAGDDTLLECRRELARLLPGFEPERIVLTKNASEALNLAILGLELSDTDVVTTEGEHNSVLRPLYRLQNRSVVRLHIVPVDSQGRVREEAWRRALDEVRPRLVALNHASNVTGAVNDAPRLLKAAKACGSLTLLDASQTAGLLPLGESAIYADLIAFPGHKYLLGPTGTGALAVKAGVNLQPVYTGGTGFRSESPEMPPEMPAGLEVGTPNSASFAGLLSSLRWGRANPLSPTIFSGCADVLRDALAGCGARLAAVDGARTGVVSFTVPGWSVNDVGYVLERSRRIVCRTGLHCAPLAHWSIGTAPEGTVRFSISRFTTAGDLERAVQAVEMIIHGTR